MTIKGFFTKLFGIQTQTQTVQNNTIADNEQLKLAARNAVKNAFEKDKSVTGNFTHPRVREILDEYNRYFFSAFQVKPENYTLKFDNQNIIVQVEDKDFAEVLTQSNKLSLSYEHILQRLIQKEFKSFTGRISLQSSQSKQLHQKNIKTLAHKMATQVKDTGQKVTIPAKSSYERSIIHQVVSKFPGLASKSVGPHHQRRLIIYSVAHNNSPAQKQNSKHVHE